jgi:hypothetical protein
MAPKPEIIYQMNTKCTYIPNGHKTSQISVNNPNGHKIYRKFPILGPPKCIPNEIFGLKINNLATLHTHLKAS